MRVPTSKGEALLLLAAILFSKPLWVKGEEFTRVTTGAPSLSKASTPVAVKKGAILHGLNAKIYTALHKAKRIWMRHGEMLVVTSGLDGRHKRGSLHYVGLAVDLRTNYFCPSTRRKVARELRHSLGDKFQVIGEKHHIHVEYDP